MIIIDQINVSGGTSDDVIHIFAGFDDDGRAYIGIDHSALESFRIYPFSAAQSVGVELIDSDGNTICKLGTAFVSADKRSFYAFAEELKHVNTAASCGRDHAIVSYVNNPPVEVRWLHNSDDDTFAVVVTIGSPSEDGASPAMVRIDLANEDDS